MWRKEDLDDGSEDGTRSTISWAKDPNRDIRLLDWIDQHEFQREIIFAVGRGRGRGSHKRGPKMTKIQCYTQIAREIFSVDADPSIRRDVAKDPKYFASATSAHMLHLRTTYQRFNEEIGPEYAMLPYEALEVGSEAYKKAAELLEWFPLWRRLHVHWRTAPGFNQFYGQSSGNSSQSTEQQSPATQDIRRSNPSQMSDPNVTQENEISSHSSNMVKNGSSGINGIPRGRHRGEAIVVEDLDIQVQTPTVKSEDEATENSTGRKRSRKRKREQGVEEEARHQHLTHQNVDLVAAREHERNLAELAIKRQKLENEALERKTAVETRRLELESEERCRAAEDKRQREKEQHEFMMRLMELATGIVKNANRDTGEGREPSEESF